MTYSEQLKDERWYIVRDGIYIRANGDCELCGWNSQNGYRDGDNEDIVPRRMDVHHKWYRPNALAWEYKPEELIYLCEKCHTFLHDAMSNKNLALVDAVSRYTKMRISGDGSFIGRCPFHDEWMGSFVVNVKKAMWFCFGCGIGGDIEAFIDMTIKNMTTPLNLKP